MGEKGVQTPEETVNVPAYEYGDEHERWFSVSLGGVQDRTHRQLKLRHIHLIGIGGTIGACCTLRLAVGPSTEIQPVHFWLLCFSGPADARW